jgi:hypothetical protein
MHVISFFAFLQTVLNLASRNFTLARNAIFAFANFVPTPGRDAYYGLLQFYLHACTGHSPLLSIASRNLTCMHVISFLLFANCAYYGQPQFYLHVINWLSKHLQTVLNIASRNFTCMPLKG